MLSTFQWVAGLGVVFTVAVAGPGPIVINEVLYDPPGPDAGGEYVELLNVSATSHTLDAGWRLERSSISGGARGRVGGFGPGGAP